MRSFESSLTLFDFGGGVRADCRGERGDAARADERGEEVGGGRDDPFGGFGRKAVRFGVAVDSVGRVELEAMGVSMSCVEEAATAAALAAINSLIDGLVTFPPPPVVTPVPAATTFFPSAALSKAFLVETSNPPNIRSVIFGQISLEAQYAARIFSFTIGFGSTNPFLMHNSSKSTPPELSTRAKDFFAP